MLILGLGLAIIVQGHGRFDGWPAPRPVQSIQGSGQGNLHDKIAEDIRGMNASGHGIFNEDIGAIVAPYFPPGITFAAAEDLARQQGLKPLKPYQGKGPGAGTMYVTTFDMMKATFSSVFVAVYFTFERDARGERTLTTTAAFLRASDM